MSFKTPRTSLLLLLEIIIVELAILFPLYIPSLIIAGLLFFIMAFNPFFNIFLMIFYLVLQYPIPGFSFGPVSIAPMQVMIAIAYFYFILDLIFKGQNDFYKFRTPFFYWLIAFTVIAFLSVFWASSKLESLRYLRDLSFWLLFAFYVVYHLRTFTDVKKILDYWIYAAVFAAVLAFLQLIFRIDYFMFIPNHRWFVPTGRFFFRLNGTFEDPNFLGNFLIAPLVISLSRIVFYKEKKQIGYSLVMFIAVLLTNSRGALLAIIFAMLFILSFSFLKKGERKKIFLSAFGIIAVFILIGLLLPFSTIKRFMPDVYKVDWASIYRLLYMYIAIQTIKANFWLGVGINNFPVVFKQYTPDAIWQALTLGGTKGVLQGGGYTHNTLLTVWSETGIFNFLLIVFFVFLAIKLLLKLNKQWNKGRNEAGLYIGIIIALFAVLLQLLTINYLSYHVFMIVFLLIFIHSKFRGKEALSS